MGGVPASEVFLKKFKYFRVDGLENVRVWLVRKGVDLVG